MSSTRWVVPAVDLCLLSFMFHLQHQSTDDDSLVTLGTVVCEASKTDIVSFSLHACYFRYVVFSLWAEDSHATKAFMAVLLGIIALVNLHARSGGSCGGVGPSLGAVVASYTLVPCLRWDRVLAFVASLTVAMTMTVVPEQRDTEVACTVLLSITLMFFVGQRRKS